MQLGPNNPTQDHRTQGESKKWNQGFLIVELCLWVGILALIGYYAYFIYHQEYSKIALHIQIYHPGKE